MSYTELVDGLVPVASPAFAHPYLPPPGRPQALKLLVPEPEIFIVNTDLFSAQRVR